MARIAPIIIPASSPPEDQAKGATFIFLHGLGDDGAAFENLAQQFQHAQKLPHLSWVLPTALENRDLMQTAWFFPTPLTPFPSQRPELDDPEDEEGMLQSVRYVSTLIDEQVASGIPLERIVVGGFSQGSAISSLLGLASKYSGKLAGICGLTGRFPLPDRIQDLRRDNGLGSDIGNMSVFLMRGKSDMIVPRRYYSMSLDKLRELGVDDKLVEAHEYEGLGHALSGAVIRDVCVWLEKIIPPLD